MLKLLPLFLLLHSASAADKPNLLFILADVMGWQDTTVPFAKECTPWNDRYHTPSLERLAREGMKFTQAYSCAVCPPTRVSLMTGRNEARHHVSNWTHAIGDNPSTDLPQPTLSYVAWNWNGPQPAAGNQDWPEDARRYAAMVAMLDRQVGEILALLKELGIEQNTLVFFSGDNGGADYFPSKEHPRGVHSANKHPDTGVEFRGKKGTLYEGGLRVPFIARWPGKIAPGSVSEHLGYFPDILPTLAEATGCTAPADTDGLSILPTLLGQNAAQKQHEYLYWEINGWTAIRQGQWRAVKPAKAKAWELYDVATDPSESSDLAAAQPDILAKLTALAAQAHEPAREGSFTHTDLHDRDRRAKYGKHDDASYIATPSGVSKKNEPPAVALQLYQKMSLTSAYWVSTTRHLARNSADTGRKLVRAAAAQDIAGDEEASQRHAPAPQSLAGLMLFATPELHLGLETHRHRPNAPKGGPVSSKRRMSKARENAPAGIYSTNAPS